MSNLTAKNIDALVMGTVNASWKTLLDADKLAQLLAVGDVETALPHLATFFSEVRYMLIVAFAKNHGIGMAQLRATYFIVKHLTGETNPALEEAFGHPMGRAA
jgi:hypothetical protein